MACSKCDQTVPQSYFRNVRKQLEGIFGSGSCAQCGESDPFVLDFSNSEKIWNLIYAGTPWAYVRPYVEGQEFLCFNCKARQAAEAGQPWTLPLSV